MSEFSLLETHISPRQIKVLERSGLTAKGLLALNATNASKALLDVKGIGPATAERVLEILHEPPPPPPPPSKPVETPTTTSVIISEPAPVSGPLDSGRERVPPEQRQAGKAIASPRVIRARKSQR